MGTLVQWELQYVSVTITVGIGLAVLYDCLRIWRRLIPHGIIWLSVEDILFWMAASLITFTVCFVEDAGNIRWFAVAGEVLGAWMYHYTVGRILVKYVSYILIFPFRMIKKALKKLSESFRIGHIR